LTTTDERKIMAKSIFYVGEIGVNDYFAALSNNDSVDVAVSLVPHIIDTIRSALTVSVDRPEEPNSLVSSSASVNY
jgi:hypothetical protein